MSFLRFLALASLGLWTGGLAALGIAAPRLFSVLEAHDPALGREWAARRLERSSRDFQHVAWGLGLVLIASLALRAALGPRPRRLAARLWVASAMLAASLVTALVLVPRINTITSETNGPVANLSPEDPARIAFDRLHGLANIIMCVTVVAGLGLTWAEMKDGA